MTSYAKNYREIPSALAANTSLAERVKALILSENILGKSTEGIGRVGELRKLLCQVVDGSLDVDSACVEVERRLPIEESEHRSNKSVFPANWGERLIRTLLSRLYNHAVLDEMNTVMNIAGLITFRMRN